MTTHLHALHLDITPVYRQLVVGFCCEPHCLLPDRYAQMWYLKSTVCDCGQQQTMNYIVNTRRLTKCNDGLQSLRDAENDTLNCL